MVFEPGLIACYNARLNDGITIMTDATHSHNSRSLESPYRPYIIIILAGTFYVYEFFLRVMPSAMTSELMLTYDINASGLGMLSAFFFYG